MRISLYSVVLLALLLAFCNDYQRNRLVHFSYDCRNYGVGLSCLLDTTDIVSECIGFSLVTSNVLLDSCVFFREIGPTMSFIFFQHYNYAYHWEELWLRYWIRDTKVLIYIVLSGLPASFFMSLLSKSKERKKLRSFPIGLRYRKFIECSDYGEQSSLNTVELNSFGNVTVVADTTFQAYVYQDGCIIPDHGDPHNKIHAFKLPNGSIVDLNIKDSIRDYRIYGRKPAIGKISNVVTFTAGKYSYKAYYYGKTNEHFCFVSFTRGVYGMSGTPVYNINGEFVSIYVRVLSTTYTQREVALVFPAYTKTMCIIKMPIFGAFQETSAVQRSHMYNVYEHIKYSLAVGWFNIKQDSVFLKPIYGSKFKWLYFVTECIKLLSLEEPLLEFDYTLKNLARITTREKILTFLECYSVDIG